MSDKYKWHCMRHIITLEYKVIISIIPEKTILYLCEILVNLDIGRTTWDRKNVDHKYL